MIVIPIDEPVKPTKLPVIELAQKVRGFDDHTYRGEGVLLYTVDLTRETGSSPVEVLPKIHSFSDNFGNLFAAPYMVGDTALARAGGGDVAVEVVQRFGESYYVTIRFA